MIHESRGNVTGTLTLPFQKLVLLFRISVIAAARDEKIPAHNSSLMIHH